MKNIIKIFVVLLLFGVSTSLAQTNEIKVRVDGLSCPFCAYGLEKKLNELEGVENININLEEGLVTLQVKDSVKISEEDIETKIEDAGFTPGEIVYSKKDEQPGKND